MAPLTSATFRQRPGCGRLGRFVRHQAWLARLLILSLFVLGSVLQLLPGPSVPSVAAQATPPSTATNTSVPASTNTPPPPATSTSAATSTPPPPTATQPGPGTTSTATPGTPGASPSPGGSPAATATVTPGTVTPGTPTPTGVATSTATAASLAGSTPTPVPTCFGERATIIGTEGNDTLDGGNGNVADVIVGLGGDDLIYGRQWR